MEIERKWIVEGWPEGLPLLTEQSMRQGYLTVRPTVRIREEKTKGGATEFILCLKSGSGIVRREIEIAIEEGKFREIEEMIGTPLIPKIRRTYLLPDGHHLEVNHVDEGTETEFWYAEIEYDSEEEARAWREDSVNLTSYLQKDVSEEKGQTMGEYWYLTRMQQSSQ